MKNLYKIFFIVLLLIFGGQRVFSQNDVQKNDTLQVQDKKSQSDQQLDNNKQAGNGSPQAGNGTQTQAVKRVRAGRPDMTRARGARPPSIIRPSGSGIPKGMGKPGGAGRYGCGR